MNQQPKLDTVLYGLTANPPHLGHLVTGWAIHAQTGLPVWYLPCYEHQFGKDIASAQDRAEMVRLMCQHYSWAYDCYWEVKQKHTGTMYETLCAMAEYWPDRQFHLAMGMDNANIIETEWGNGKKLINEFPCIVFSRPGVKPRANWFRSEPHQQVEVHWPMSSSLIRQRIQEGDLRFVKRNVPEPVYNFMRLRMLYGWNIKHEGLEEE